MTFIELKTETELLYESINSSTTPGFLDAEWSRIFTVAQRKVVLDILQEGINKNTFNQMAISKLVQKDSYTSFIDDTHYRNSDGTTFAKKLNIGVGGKVFDSKFFWILDEYVTTASYVNIPILRITFDFYRENLDNPFRKPDPIEGYWLLQYASVVPGTSTSIEPVFITDGTVITGYYIIGVFHPDNYPISSTAVYPVGGTQASCLNESVHYRIVEKAVTLARMSVDDPSGYQLALNEFIKK